jgi:transposase InsO family protein
MQERRAEGTSLAQVGRELEIEPDLLRKWARQLGQWDEPEPRVENGAGAAMDLLTGNGMSLSMSRSGDCWDNAVAESFFATLKTELVVDAHWHTRRDAKAALVEFIEVWYNRQRRHQTLGYKTPVQYELEVLKRANAA